LAVFDEK